MNQEFLKLSIPPLLDWYVLSRRSLPFRQDPTPYHIWVSEIMLQQTRVSAAIPYYERFIRELPTIRDLANCSEEKLLKLWQGLGYYNRVRNLQKGAREVCERFGGQLPKDYDALRSVTGIGEYTAGAIASIAFSLKTPAVDGNVLRVVSRITGDTRPITDVKLRQEYADVLRPLMPDERESDFTQALMELGALVCVPNGSPLCDVCPVSTFCTAHREGLTDVIPNKPKKTKRRTEERTVYLVFSNDRVLLHKRPDTGLLRGLWEFVNVKKGETLPLFLQGVASQKVKEAKHIFSHIEWKMQAYLVELDTVPVLPEGYVFASEDELEREYAVPSAFSAFVPLVRERMQSGGKNDAGAH